VLLRNFPFVGEVRLTVLTRLRERAIRSFRTIDRMGPSKRDFTSQSENIITRDLHPTYPLLWYAIP